MGDTARSVKMWVPSALGVHGSVTHLRANLRSLLLDGARRSPAEVEVAEQLLRHTDEMFEGSNRLVRLEGDREMGAGAFDGMAWPPPEVAR